MPTDFFKNIFYNSLTVGFIAFVTFLFLGQKDIKISGLHRRRIWVGLTVIMLTPVRVVLPYFPVITHSPFQRLYIAATNKIPTQDIIDRFENFIEIQTFMGLNILELATLIWLIVAIAFFTIYVVNYVVFVLRVVPFCRIIKYQIYKDICQRVRNELNLDENFNVYFCFFIKQPIIIGLMHQKILIPYKKYSSYGFYFMVKRQMIHCSGKHIRYLFLIKLANAIHWFNPFSYKILEQYRRDIESLSENIITLPLSKNGLKTYYETYYREYSGYTDSFKYNNVF